MKINYFEILNKNMINVFKDILKDIKINGLHEGHHLYITFDTNNKKAIIPQWLKDKYEDEMTIVIQYEYWDFKIKKNSFNIGLSFSEIKTNLEIPFDSVISFADPYANFGLKLTQDVNLNDKKNIKHKKNLKNLKIKEENNIIQFKKLR